MLRVLHHSDQNRISELQLVQSDHLVDVFYEYYKLQAAPDPLDELAPLRVASIRSIGVKGRRPRIAKLGSRAG